MNKENRRRIACGLKHGFHQITTCHGYDVPENAFALENKFTAFSGLLPSFTHTKRSINLL